jgi:hypothetical protein
MARHEYHGLPDHDPPVERGTVMSGGCDEKVDWIYRFGVVVQHDSPCSGHYLAAGTRHQLTVAAQ